ncbi:MAG: hypothetical protein U0271_34460 [Polyangiaceae bacterium]
MGDFMCGSGTTAVVAARLGRAFFASDAGDLAIEIAHKRLTAAGARFRFVSRPKT